MAILIIFVSWKKVKIMVISFLILFYYIKLVKWLFLFVNYNKYSTEKKLNSFLLLLIKI